MTEAKIKIQALVKDYKRIFPDEYIQFSKELKQVRYHLKDAFAQAKGSDMIEREVYRMPETLWALIGSRLNDNEAKWFNSTKGQKWFAQTFKEFRVTKSY